MEECNSFGDSYRGFCIYGWRGEGVNHFSLGVFYPCTFHQTKTGDCSQLISHFYMSQKAELSDLCNKNPCHTSRFGLIDSLRKRKNGPVNPLYSVLT